MVTGGTRVSPTACTQGISQLVLAKVGWAEGPVGVVDLAPKGS